MFSLFYNPPALHSPIVIGHRGSSEGVENTLVSIQGGIDQGADYAEIDILLSKDNVPMVIHDSNLQRLSGQNVNVYDLTAEELGELTLSQNDTEGKISTLEEVIKATKGQIKLLIELKTHGHETADVAAETAKVVEAQNDEKLYVHVPGLQPGRTAESTASRIHCRLLRLRQSRQSRHKASGQYGHRLHS